jgi:hypothetical protein
LFLKRRNLPFGRSELSVDGFLEGSRDVGPESGWRGGLLADEDPSQGDADKLSVVVFGELVAGVVVVGCGILKSDCQLLLRW